MAQIKPCVYEEFASVSREVVLWTGGILLVNALVLLLDVYSGCQLAERGRFNAADVINGDTQTVCN